MDAPIHTILSAVLAQHVDGASLDQATASAILTEVLDAVYPGAVDTRTVAPERVGSYTIACERLSRVEHEVRPLHFEHWSETETHRHELTCNPDYERGRWLELQGRYLLIGVRHADSGQLVGNYGLYLSRSTQTQKLIATEDTMFISRAHRKGRLGVALIRYVERALATLGVEELQVSVKQVNAVGQMIERLGYVPTGKQYTKVLTEVGHVQP